MAAKVQPVRQSFLCGVTRDPGADFNPITAVGIAHLTVEPCETVRIQPWALLDQCLEIPRDCEPSK